MIHKTEANTRLEAPSVVTLGNFDGIHTGHRVLINKTIEYAGENSLTSVVFTFNPHPMFYFNNRSLNKLILSRHEKEYVIGNMGVDVYIECPFDKELCETSADDFILNLIFKNLKAKAVIVGENFRFGAKQQGTPDLIRRYADELGIEVIVVPSVMYNGIRISSTRVRQCLIDTDVELANRLLFEPYFMIGTVSEGKKLGRKLGFPTVNLVADEIKLFPSNGVYATKTLYNGAFHTGVTNVGINPTVHGTKKIVETFLFDFNKEIYGERLMINFFKFIRPEKKFDSIDELMKEIDKNSGEVKEYFGSSDFNHWKELGY